MDSRKLRWREVFVRVVIALDVDEVWRINCMSFGPVPRGWKFGRAF
jgi:hypothetical protein